jgi:predicted alpha/beta-hydrolase family hydrolase
MATLPTIGGVRDYPAADPSAPLLVLAHGAGAGHDHPWVTRLAAGLAARGVRVVTFNFPYMEEGRRLPDRGPVLEEAFRAVWQTLAPTATGRLFAGGKSMGGRIACQAAASAALTPPPAGLVLFGYPLHPPAKPAQRRDQHLPGIGVPMLFVQGTRDPFGSPEEMRALANRLPTATLELVDGGDHSLALPRKQDPRGEAIERTMDIAAAWMKRRT